MLGLEVSEMFCTAKGTFRPDGCKVIREYGAHQFLQVGKLTKRALLVVLEEPPGHAYQKRDQRRQSKFCHRGY